MMPTLKFSVGDRVKARMLAIPVTTTVLEIRRRGSTCPELRLEVPDWLASRIEPNDPDKRLLRRHIERNKNDWWVFQTSVENA